MIAASELSLAHPGAPQDAAAPSQHFRPSCLVDSECYGMQVFFATGSLSFLVFLHHLIYIYGDRLEAGYQFKPGENKLPIYPNMVNNLVGDAHPTPFCDPIGKPKVCFLCPGLRWQPGLGPLKKISLHYFNIF